MRSKFSIDISNDWVSPVYVWQKQAVRNKPTILYRGRGESVKNVAHQQIIYPETERVDMESAGMEQPTAATPEGPLRLATVEVHTQELFELFSFLFSFHEKKNEKQSYFEFETLETKLDWRMVLRYICMYEYVCIYENTNGQTNDNMEFIYNNMYLFSQRTLVWSRSSQERN